MPRSIKPFLPLLCALLLCAACAAPAPAAPPEAAPAPLTLTDMMGRPVSLPGPATRIVALAAADCEILCAIGAETALVGRGEYCDYPAQLLALPVVQSGAETNIEQIIDLAPEAVVMNIMAQTTAQVEALEKAGIPVVATNAQSIEGVYEDIRLMGALTGKNAGAAVLEKTMRQRFAALQAQVKPAGKTVYFEASPLQYGLWAAGGGTFMDELAEMLGLTNIFADLSGWAEVSEEQVIARDPDYIVTNAMYFGEGETPVAEIMGRAGWQGMTAIQNGAVFNADADAISRPGPRLAEAAEALFAFVYGDETAPGA